MNEFDYFANQMIVDVDRQIGNAVPPTMARVLAEANRPVLMEARHA